MNAPPRTSANDLAPLAYHRAVVAYLQGEEPEVWAWASRAEAEREYLERMRTMLLRECYRLEADGHPELIDSCARVAARLGISVPITLYQANGVMGMNAALYSAPGEAHIVFTGPVLSRLQGAELEAVLGHELAHYVLWDVENKAHLIADRIMNAAAGDVRCSASHTNTARRMRLYTEVFADRGGYIGCGSLEAAVAALVKIETGLDRVSATSYLRQAEELFARVERGNQGHDHPDLFIRARALRLWSEGDAGLDAWLAAEIEGDATIDSLCVIGQQRVRQLTRRLLGELLQPKWMHTDSLLGHAKSFFADFRPGGAFDALQPEDLSALKAAGAHDYWCYVLLDFARADRDLEEVPLAHCLTISRRLGLNERFEPLVIKELGMTQRQLTRLLKEAPELLRNAGAQ